MGGQPGLEVRPSWEDLVVQASGRRHPIENQLVQFTVLSFVILAILGVVLSVILTTRLSRDFEILKEQAALTERGVAPTAGGLTVPLLDTDLNYLRWTTYVSVGGGFIILYTGLIWIFWRGWKTIERQQDHLLQSNADLGRAYRELQTAQEKLVRSERLAAIGELSAGVAHDLRNPLGAIKNATYFLRGKTRDAEDPRVAEFLDIMDEEIESSNQILTDLMDFARVNPPSQAPTELESIVDSALSRIQLKDSVKVAKRFASPMPVVQADSEQLHRVFDNLLKNADDAMPNGGRLTISGKSTDGWAELRFTDSGPGISETDLARVMEPLFTTKAKGIGLGLAIVNMIIERHDGTVTVDSKKGEGTTFTIRLPVSDQDQSNGS